MNNNNAFLKEFLAMRKSITPASSAAATKSPEDVLPKKKNGRSKAKPQMKQELQTEKPGLMTIVETKPHKRVVIEYLQLKANDLTEEKMK